MVEADTPAKPVEAAEDILKGFTAEDKPAQHGASMGEHCTSDRPPPSGGEQPSGEISKIADIDVYIAKPSDYPHLPSKLLFLLSSGTGIHSQNNQLQADKYAQEGFLVVMPDQFAGDPVPKSSTDPSAFVTDNPSFIEQVKLGVATTAKSFLLDMWLARQTPEKVLPILLKVIEGAKEEFADAVANGGGIYAAGYCFGGKYVCLLASESSDADVSEKSGKDEEHGVVKKEPLIKCGTFAHGTDISHEDLKNVKSPVSIIAVENDQLFPDEVRNAGQKYLEEAKIEHELELYSEVPHGFAVVGEYEDAKIQDAQKRAFTQMVSWLKAH